MPKKLYQMNESYFDIIDTDEKAYWLGYLYADGYVAQRAPWFVIIQTVDHTHLERFREALAFTGHIKQPKHSGGYPGSKQQSRITLCSKKLCTSLNRLGLTSPQKQLPNIRLNKRAAFMRGVFDGDGSVTLSQRYCTQKQKRYGPYPTLSYSIILHKDHLETIQQWLTESNVESYICDSKTDYMKYIKWSSAESARAFGDWIYSAAGPYLDRKYQVFRTYSPSGGQSSEQTQNMLEHPESQVEESLKEMPGLV